MSPLVDLRELLQSWPFDPARNARLVQLGDDREILQVRTPMGIEQYELDGRPDGQRPHRRESALDYQQQRLAQARNENREGRFQLNEQACAELFDEGILYYQRYLHLFQLQDWRRTVRDTSRNLILFDFVHRYAEREQDRMFLEQWRPYLVRINTIAAAMIELARDGHTRALSLLRAAITTIEELPEMDDESFRFERKRSLGALRDLAAQVERTRPLSTLERLERELRRVIEAQEFERAAELRDRIKALRQTPESPVETPPSPADES